MRHPPAELLLVVLAVAGCGGGDQSTSKPAPLPDAGSLIPVAPAPQPTATPTPGTEPDEDPLPAGGGGTSASCGEPVPPAVSRMSVGIHSRSGNNVLLDSTPLVGPDVAYCRLIGYTDGRSYCPVRPEGSPERFACEAMRVGRAADTGRIGPTWTIDGRPCNGSLGNGCVNHAANQFQVDAYGTGTFRACTASSACGQLKLP
ncbi:MAG TPA: hypothetical protein VEQ10_00825 [Vicinamibacteria bacterium]|nr:hypothetical protein [Vicinamibacteria bacterium]